MPRFQAHLSQVFSSGKRSEVLVKLQRHSVGGDVAVEKVPKSDLGLGTGKNNDHLIPVHRMG